MNKKLDETVMMRVKKTTRDKVRDEAKRQDRSMITVADTVIELGIKQQMKAEGEKSVA